MTDDLYDDRTDGWLHGQLLRSQMTDDLYDDRTDGTGVVPDENQSRWTADRTRRGILVLLAGAVSSALLVLIDRFAGDGYGNSGYGSDGFGK